MYVATAFAAETPPFTCAPTAFGLACASTAFAAETPPLPCCFRCLRGGDTAFGWLVLPPPSRLRHRLSLVRPPPSRLRQRLCVAVPGTRRPVRRARTTTSLTRRRRRSRWARSVQQTRTAVQHNDPNHLGLLRQTLGHRLCLVLPLPSWLRHCLCLVCLPLPPWRRHRLYSGCPGAQDEWARRGAKLPARASNGQKAPTGRDGGGGGGGGGLPSPAGSAGRRPHD